APARRRPRTPARVRRVLCAGIRSRPGPDRPRTTTPAAPDAPAATGCPDRPSPSAIDRAPDAAPEDLGSSRIVPAMAPGNRNSTPRGIRKITPSRNLWRHRRRRELDYSPLRGNDDSTLTRGDTTS